MAELLPGKHKDLSTNSDKEPKKKSFLNACFIICFGLCCCLNSQWLCPVCCSPTGSHFILSFVLRAQHLIPGPCLFVGSLLQNCFLAWCSPSASIPGIFLSRSVTAAAVAVTFCHPSLAEGAWTQLSQVTGPRHQLNVLLKVSLNSRGRRRLFVKRYEDNCSIFGGGRRRLLASPYTVTK